MPNSKLKTQNSKLPSKRRVSRTKSVGSLFITTLDFTESEAAGLLRKMAAIRRLDESLVKLARRKGASVDPAPGREAIAVGACSVLKASDYVFGDDWRHGLMIARTGIVVSALSEFQLHSRNGASDHAPAAGNTVFSGGMALAIGSALACRLNKQNQVVLCFCSPTDAAQGSFHESMNLAASWKLPVIFIFPELESGKSSSRGRVFTQAQHYGIEGVLCDGSSLIDVRAAVSAACDRARNGKGATLIEAAVPAAKNHPALKAAVEGDAESDIKSLRDPIRIFRNLLAEAALLTEKDVINIEREVAVEVKNAMVHATENCPTPAREALLKNVYKGWVEGRFGLMRV